MTKPTICYPTTHERDALLLMFSKACLVASVTPYIWQIHI